MLLHRPSLDFAGIVVNMHTPSKQLILFFFLVTVGYVGKAYGFPLSEGSSGVNNARGENVERRENSPLPFWHPCVLTILPSS